MSIRRKGPSGPVPAKLKAALAAKKAATSGKSAVSVEKKEEMINSDPVIHALTPTNINNFQGTAKENENVTSAVNIFNSNTKQYKKALKIVDGNLKKNSVHFNSLVVKALLLVKLEKPLDAKFTMEKALGKVPGSTKKKINFNIISAMGCHLISSYYKELDEFEENYVWLQRAYEAGGGFQNQAQAPMLNQLCLLAAQLRKYPDLLNYRQHYLNARPGYRANWSGLALALDLNHQKKEAIARLTQFEEAAVGKLGEKEAYEHGECTMYKNDLMFKVAKSDEGELRVVIKHLSENEDVIQDKIAYWERVGEVYVTIGDFANASKVFRRLIKKNPDNFKYFKMLELTLNVKYDVPKKTRMYANLLKLYPSSEPARFGPLTFLEDELELKAYLAFYLDLYWSKGVLATFQLLKPLFKNVKKTHVFQKLVKNICLQRLEKLDKESHDGANSASEKLKQPVKFLLANLYLFQRDTVNAMQVINECIAADSCGMTLEFELFKARVLKHETCYGEAVKILESVRSKDLKDRFLNNKAVKYHLRNNEADKAVELISLFTKNDSSFASTGIPDLHSLQCNWFIVEQAEAYKRQYELLLSQIDSVADYSEKLALAKKMLEYRNLSIKRFEAVLNIYKIYKNDQYDFNSYCLRRGTVRHLLDLVTWSDKIHTLPVYKRALNGLLSLALSIPKFAKAIKDVQNKLFIVNHKPADIKKVISQAPEADTDPFGDRYNGISSSSEFIKSVIKSEYEKYSTEISKKKRDYILSFILEFKTNNLSALTSLVSDFKEKVLAIQSYDDLTFNDSTGKLMEEILKLSSNLTRDSEETLKIKAMIENYCVSQGVIPAYINRQLIDGCFN
ncbi:hypothetical protein QEN19_004018 [Hanseniaspora menglaensis]